MRSRSARYRRAKAGVRSRTARCVGARRPRSLGTGAAMTRKGCVRGRRAVCADAAPVACPSRRVMTPATKSASSGERYAVSNTAGGAHATRALVGSALRPPAPRALGLRCPCCAALQPPRGAARESSSRSARTWPPCRPSAWHAAARWAAARATRCWWTTPRPRASCAAERQRNTTQMRVARTHRRLRRCGSSAGACMRAQWQGSPPRPSAPTSI